MKKILLLLISFSLFINALAQQNEIDSLNQLLQKEKTDTGRVLLMSKLGLAFLESNTDTTMKIALQGLELSRHIHYEKGEAVSLNRIGSVYSVLGNYPKAISYYLKALQINEKIRYIDGQGSNIMNIGNVYSYQNDHRLALQYFFKSSELENPEDKSNISITMGNIAGAYRELKVYDSAILYAQQSFNLASQANYSRMIGFALSTLGSIHFQTGQNNLAMEYCRLSFPHLTASKNYKGLSDAYLTTAKVFDRLHQNDSASFYAKQSIAIAKERGFNKEVRDAARFLSRYYRKYNADSAFFYQDIAVAMNDSLFSQEKQKDLQTQAFDEQIRQNEIATAALIAKEERNHNLQYAAIAIGIITFIILFFVLGRSTVVNEKFINFFGILGLLAVFEFINLYIHPHLAHWTNHSPVWMLLILMCIAALLIPLHHRMEKWITKIMVEKNKKIRLAAAHKTIATLSDKN